MFTPGECFGAENSELSLILAQQGGETWSSTVETSGTAPAATVGGDFDGDGQIEVLVFDRTAQNFELFRADAFGGLDPVTVMSFAELCPDCSPPDQGAANIQMGAGDFDGDPTDDLLLTFNDSMHVGLNPLTAAPTWVEWPDPGSAVYRQRVLDVDQDGADDILYSEGPTDTTHCLLNRY